MTATWSAMTVAAALAAKNTAVTGSLKAPNSAMTATGKIETVAARSAKKNNKEVLK